MRTVPVFLLLLSSVNVLVAESSYNISICHNKKKVYKIGYGVWTGNVQLKKNSTTMDGSSIDHLEG